MIRLSIIRHGLYSPQRRASLITIFSAVLIAILLVSTPESIRRKVSAQPAPIETTISTLAGGGFGSNVPARQAPMALPTGAALDPLGRGIYVVDEVNGTSLLRFLNTGTEAATIGGVTIPPGNINLIAGGGSSINDNVPPRDADLAEITGLAIDPSGNMVYLTIPSFSLVRAINVGGQPVTVLGKTITPGTIATILSPDFGDFRGIAIHPATRELHFIAGRIVLKVSASGTQTVVAGGGTPSAGLGDGGPATRARLITPIGLAFDGLGNLLIADGGDARDVPGNVRRVVATGTISSIASGLEFPTGITTAPNGDLYVALGNAQQIARIGAGGIKTIIAGNSTQQVCDMTSMPTCGDGGPALQAGLNIPDSTSNKTLTIAANAQGIILPDFRYKRLRFINPTNGGITIAGTAIPAAGINTIAGNGLASPYDGQPATSAELFVPTGVTADQSGNLYISDTGNNRLRFVNRTTAPVTLFLTTPFATTVQPGQIVTLNRNAGDAQLDDRITTALFLAPQGLQATSNGILIVDSQAGALIKVPPSSVTGRRSGVIRFLNTSSTTVTFFPNGGDAKVDVAPGEIKDIAGVRPPANPQALGDGQTANRVAFYPTDIAVDRNGNLFVADQGNNRIRRIDAQSAVVTTAYGDSLSQTLFSPTGIAFDGANRLHIADTRNNRIFRQNAAGGSVFTIIADSAKGVNRPRDLTVDSMGRVFFTNSVSNQVMQLDAPNNAIGTTFAIAGNGTQGFGGDDGPSPDARLSLPNPGTATNDIQVTANIIALANGDLIFTDTGNNRVRRLKRKSGTAAIASVSAASFSDTDLAAESIVASFGERLATGVQVSTTTPLPVSLLGTIARIRDSLGTERSAPLFFVAPGQINLQIPPGTATGPAQITITGGDGSISTGTMMIAMVAPGFFTANANGQGVAAAVVLRVSSITGQTFEPIARFDSAQNKFVPIPIDLGAPSDQLFLVLFGTGFRFRSSLAGVSATIGGAGSEVLFAGPADGFVGLDQANLRIPRTLAGRGEVSVVFTVDGKPANPITLQVK
jgi:uncharacterized protein (TIGR03437 family)